MTKRNPYRGACWDFQVKPDYTGKSEIVREPGKPYQISPMDRSQFNCQDCLDSGTVLGPERHPVWPNYVPCPTCQPVEQTSR
jgi:hypothetical protein